MKYFVMCMLLGIGFISCTNKLIQCNHKPLKHKTYRVKKGKKKNYQPVTSASTQTGRTKQTTIPANSQNYRAINYTSKAPENSSIKNEIIENNVPIIETVTKENEQIQPRLVEPKDSTNAIEYISEQEEEKQPIYFASNITKQTFQSLQNQNTAFNPDLHIQFQNKKYSKINNITFFKTIVYNNNLAEDINQADFTSTLNTITNNNNSIVEIHVPNQPSLLLERYTKEKKQYDIVHIIDGDFYEVFHQELSGLQALITEEICTESEITTQLNQLLLNRATDVKNYLIHKGIPTSNITMQQSSAIQHIVIKIK